ncbi:putative zinc finger, C2H2 type [Lyophyllum shimeji]|uniref:Zinc finger, C2H2 type n=1 Tax=Lyophyllum shimeji TaxID=47721 RepID=A0A9P3PT61_LYOSH|nr:putative zinc finger, C2H2 type [Lyophyllum shimeji]
MAPKTAKDVNTEPCEVCGAVIRYKADVPRHRRLHENTAMMYKCPFKGCEYQNLQKSNLNTHIRTHTGEKPHACPDCEFRTADPGSLTRHRKRTHGYVPKHNSANAKHAGTKQSRRHAPYRRRTSEESLSASSSSSLEQISEELLNFSPFLASPSSACEPVDMTCDTPQDKQFSYTWDQDLFHSEGPRAASNLEPCPALTSAPVMPHIFPAAGACQQLENVNEYSFDVMDAFFNQYPSTPAFPATYSHIMHEQTTSGADPQWTFDLSTLQLPLQQPRTSDAVDLGFNAFSADEFIYGSPVSFSSSSPSASFSDSPSPSSWYSVPSPPDLFFAGPSSTGLSLPRDTLEFVFPDPISVC